MCDYCVRAVIGNALVIWPIWFCYKVLLTTTATTPIFKRQGNQALFSITRQATVLPPAYSLICVYWKTSFMLAVGPREILGFASPATGTKLKFTSTFPLWKGFACKRCSGTIIKLIMRLKNSQDFLSIQELHLCASIWWAKLSGIFLKASSLRNYFRHMTII